MRKMKNSWNILILIGLVITGVWFYMRHQERKRRQREFEAKEREERRQKLFDFYKSKLDSIVKAVRQFSAYLDFTNGYFTNNQLTVWITQNESLYREIKDVPFENIQLHDDEIKTIKTFLYYFSSSGTLVMERNQSFVKDELKTYSRFFDNIEGLKLDSQQRTAIVTDEDNNIIVAGAGSGKTTTTIGKVSYVIDRYKTNPNEILLISFTRKSAQDLRDRIKIEGVEAMTFHKFGKTIIKEVEGKEPSIFGDTKDEVNRTSELKELLKRFFNEQIQNENYVRKVTEYFSDFLKPTKDQSEFENQGDYIQYLKDQNFKTYKKIQPQGHLTLHREIVKSIEECKIANFLLFNSIDYKYEERYEFDVADFDHRQYKPDFSIYKNGKRIYLEHLGISRSRNVPRWFAKDGQTYEQAKNEYNDKINWARNVHQEYGTTLIETFSYEMSEGTLFENLTEKLIEEGIVLTPKTPQEIWEIIKNVADDEVNSFITLFQTFITLMKSNNFTIADVIQKNYTTTDDFLRQRNKLFIEIINPIYTRYENYLVERREIDFSDMINKATKYLSNGNYQRQFKYVIIDEFQDISIGRYKLIKAIKQNNPTCKLFCVGDDWQSIYRFSGSDIALFKEFNKYFGYTVKSKIETTYRFHNPLINLSSEFIQKNQNQARKQLRGTANYKSTTYQIRYSINDNQDDTNSLKEILDELISTKNGIENKKIFILGRYNFDIDRIKNERKIFHIDKQEGLVTYSGRAEEGSVKELRARFLTVHKAKGLEADVVIIINCNSGKHGFPSEMSDDTVLNLLLSEADQYENGEERRLFYVAMTRAKENVYFVADSSYKSKFIAELELENNTTEIKKCPRCRTSDLVRRTGTSKNGREWAFWGCSNYRYGCDFQKWEN
jgi:DNA helicase-4